MYADKTKQNEFNGFIGMIKYTLAKQQGPNQKSSQQKISKQLIMKLKRKKIIQFKSKRFYTALYQSQMSNLPNKSIVSPIKKKSYFDIYKQSMQKKNIDRNSNHLSTSLKNSPIKNTNYQKTSPTQKYQSKYQNFELLTRRFPTNKKLNGPNEIAKYLNKSKQDHIQIRYQLTKQQWLPPIAGYLKKINLQRKKFASTSSKFTRNNDMIHLQNLNKIGNDIIENNVIQPWDISQDDQV